MPSSPQTILVVGSGGREHALCWKLAQSRLVEKIYCAPGNGGTAGAPKTTNIEIKVDDFEKIAAFSQANQVDLIVVGPDNPLADGIVDFLTERKLTVFGPVKAAARLEWSKAFAKEFMDRHQLPTARFVIATTHEQALKLAKQNAWARVVKYDGLALGKGVFVCDSAEEVEQALEKIFVKKSFGDASRAILEERLQGEELSLLFFCDGKQLIPMPACQDHKRRYDGDTGPNTGGMGVYSPVELYDRCASNIQSRVIEPLRKALNSGELHFCGVLYVGLIVDSGNNPHILEFNARFGDPETQALMPLLDSDLAEILWQCVEGKLAKQAVAWKNAASCCVVAAARHYPGSSSKGETIKIGALPSNSQIFHAGTAIVENKLVTQGGRVLAVTAVGSDLSTARDLAYKALDSVTFSDMDYRKDIARRATQQCLSN